MIFLNTTFRNVESESPLLEQSREFLQRLTRHANNVVNTSFLLMCSTVVDWFFLLLTNTDQSRVQSPSTCLKIFDGPRKCVIITFNIVLVFKRNLPVFLFWYFWPIQIYWDMLKLFIIQYSTVFSVQPTKCRLASHYKRHEAWRIYIKIKKITSEQSVLCWWQLSDCVLEV